MTLKTRTLILALLLPIVSLSQSEKKIDSLTQIISQTKIDSVKAKVYLDTLRYHHVQ